MKEALRLSLEPVHGEVGNRGRCVVSDEVRCAVDVGELDMVGVPLGVAADPFHVLLAPGSVAAAEHEEGGHCQPAAAVDAATQAHGFGQDHAPGERTDGCVDGWTAHRCEMGIGGFLRQRVSDIRLGEDSAQ